MQPKIVVAENVKGLLLGDARNYVRRILKEFDEAGYYVIYNLLDASKMGVPQRRERVFFTAIRKDLSKNLMRQVDMFTSEPFLDLNFKEKEITFGEIEQPFKQENGRHIPAGILPYWQKIQPGRSCADVHPKGHYFQELKLDPNRALPTLRAGSNSYYHYETPRRLFDDEIKLGGSYPMDYNFMKNPVIYLVGMSVPPLMKAKLSAEIYNQWLINI